MNEQPHRPDTAAAAVRRARLGAAGVAVLGVGLLTLVWLSVPGARASGGVYQQTAHGNPDTGVLRVDGEPRGECSQCHVQHASLDGIATPGPFPRMLFAPADNQLCSGGGGAFGCHSTATPLGSYAGPALYDESSHQTSPSMVWPGPVPRARPAGDAGYCVNCHTPHGRGDAQGLIPALGNAREESACLTCHDGSGPAFTDVGFDAAKVSRHPATDFVGLHRADEGGNPALAFGPGNRHAECVDCHNPHDVRSTLRVVPPAASARNQRVSRVSVSNVSAGSRPVYTFRGADDPAPVLEYEICFKCHSAWSGQPVGQADMSLLFNTRNASFHPVEAAGRNPGIHPGAFVSGWNAGRLTYCGDCHGSDDDRVAGPHGSIHDGLLRARYPASPAPRDTSPDELCFKCHRYETYGDDEAPDSVTGYSRWNSPGDDHGHTKHVQEERVPCYSCHDSHGAADQPSLLILGRRPGIFMYMQTPGGGTCGPTCHGSENYTVNYPR